MTYPMTQHGVRMCLWVFGYLCGRVFVCMYVLCSCLMFISRKMANEPKMTQEVYVDNQDLAMLISRDFP